MRLPESIRHGVLALTVGWLAAITCTSLSAQTLKILQAVPLRGERSQDAPVVASMSAGQRVDLLQMRGGWVQVRAGAARGWLRASQLEMPGAQVSATQSLETGRRAPGATVVTLGVRSLPPRNTRHALIIGVGAYRQDPARVVTPLAGVRHDIVSAMALARLLQVPNENMTVLRDAAATREGVQQALLELDGRVQPGDRVFFYWSGHGSRYFDATAGGCIETLVPYDLRDIGNQDFAGWFQPLARKADKMLVVYDACHSGGVDGTSSIANRSLAAAWRPKATPAAADACRPSNLRTRSLESATQALGLSRQDIVHVSSSRPDEVSFDNADFGGLSTSSLLECASGQAKDLDGSGAISIDEIAACAQARLEVKLKPYPQLEPHHLVVSGNRAFVPAWFAGNPTPNVTAPDVTPSPPASPDRITVAVPPQGESAASVGVDKVLEQIHAQRDDKRRVVATLASQRLRIGADALDLSVTSSHDGHVYVAMLGSDRKSLYMLFPNGLDAVNRIRAGESMLLPRSAWRMVASGPKGKDTLLVLVTDGPRDLSALSGGTAGPFAMPLTDANGRTQLQWLLGQRGAAGESNCVGAGCSEAFGATLVDVEEY